MTVPAMAHNNESVAVPLRRRVIKACTACKQSKVRCDADGKTGKTCTRCRQRGLECEVDASFKRTPVRERMKAMAAELKELRQTVREGNTSPERPYLDILTGVDMDRTSETSTYPSPTSLHHAGDILHPPFGVAQDDPLDIAIQPSSFGPIVFSIDEIRECFRAYGENFHPHLPILNPRIKISDMQQCSPLLFKTILAIVCQRFPALQRNDHEFQLLAQVYQRLLNQSILSGPLTLHTIQAILLICAWPFPPPYQLAEPSWLYCGVATNAASYLNLGRLADKPSYHGGQLSSLDVENMSRTWIGLFLVSTSIATYIGAPLPFKHSSDLAGIEGRLARKEIPRTLAAHAALTIVLAKHGGVLSSTTDISTHRALVQMHSDEMDRVSHQYQDIWSDRLEFFLQAGKLHLYTPLYTRGSFAPNVVDGQNATASGETLFTATMAACRVITLYDRLVGFNLGADSAVSLPPSTIAAILPKTYYRRLTHAAFFLLRFVCFNKACWDSDRENARQHIHTAVMTLKRTTRGPPQRDEMTRAAAVLEKLLGHGDSLQEQGLLIDDRGGASIYWDTLHRSLQIRGIPTTRTDLMDLIDPTRTVKNNVEEGGVMKDTGMPTPGPSSTFFSGAGNQSGAESLLWDDSLMEFFDLTTFDMGDFDISLAA